MYNRDYLTDKTNSYSNESSQQAYIMSFLKATYQLFAGSLLATTAGAYIGLGIVNYIAGPMMWVLFAIELGLIFFGIQSKTHSWCKFSSTFCIYIYNGSYNCAVINFNFCDAWWCFNCWSSIFNDINCFWWDFNVCYDD